ncbi:hypothetical protein HZB78_00045 [Candidatus Collierbacteria bacterium]|nr:hypothetical protein [Candidatus Collierbacteria bacterium]
MKYSIWIIPPEPIFSQLSKIINELSLKYNCPVFKPHLTILGNMDHELSEIKQVVEKIVSDLDDLNLSFGPVSFSTTYFQSVLIRVNSTAKLMQLHFDIKKLLKNENIVYMPHISLMYGNHDMETREKIASGLSLNLSSFTAKQVVIIPEKPKPVDWKPVAIISFGNKFK